MKHISHNNDPARQVMRDQLLQTEQIFLHDAGRHGNTGFTEMSRLPQMQI